MYGLVYGCGCHTDCQSKMWIISLFLLLSGSVLMVTCFGSLLGPGQWLVLNADECENPDQYKLQYEISRKKVNRTHDCFSGVLYFYAEMNRSYSIQIDIYKEMDGGFKYYQTMADQCGCSFLMRYAEYNVKRALTMAGINPPDCPIAQGKYVINDFVMDYSEINANGVYGTFKVYIYFILAGEKVSCIQVLLNFDRRNGQED